MFEDRLGLFRGTWEQTSMEPKGQQHWGYYMLDSLLGAHLAICV